MGFFDSSYDNMYRLAKNLIFPLEFDDNSFKISDKLVEIGGKNGAAIILKILENEKDNSNINWFGTLITLDLINENIGDETEEFVKRGIALYQQYGQKYREYLEIPENLIGSYDYRKDRILGKYIFKELLKIGRRDFDLLINEILRLVDFDLELEKANFSKEHDIQNQIIEPLYLQLIGELKNPKSIDILISWLKNEYISKKEGNVKGIINTLANIGTPAVSSLTDLLFEDNVKIREESARAFSALSQVLYSDPSEKVKYYASKALAKIGFPAVDTLIQAIQDQNPVVRRFATNALGKIEDRRALKPLTQVLSDIDPKVQTEASKAIEQICIKYNLNSKQFIRKSQYSVKAITEVKKFHSSQAFDPMERLKKLKELMDMGAITKEEFQMRKNKLMKEI